MDEIWKPIPNYDFDYAVSNTGKVASMKWNRWKVLRSTRNAHGYMQVHLCDGDGGKRTIKVHTLVAEAFIGPRPTPKHQVNHIDGVKTNPRADNLEWATGSENMRHALDVLGHKNPCGEAHGMTTLTEADVREILRRCAAGETKTRVAADYGVSRPSVSMIATGKRWGWLK